MGVQYRQRNLPTCDGAVKVIAFIQDPLVIDKILTQLDKKGRIGRTGGVAAKPGATTKESVRLIFRTTPLRFKKLQPLRSRPGPFLLAPQKSVFFPGITSTESRIRWN